MFVLTTISDLIQIQPKELHKPKAEALEDNINRKYANRVLHNVGLCICLWDVIRVSEGLFGQGDGTVNVNIEFRLVVFRPFRGEILQGVVLENTKDGLRIGMDFFVDVWIPSDFLPEGAKLRSETPGAAEVWCWDPEDDLTTSFWYDNFETVRFRVEEEVWHVASPEKRDFSQNANGDKTLREAIKREGEETKKKKPTEMEKAVERQVPYAIVGSMSAPGLGAIWWWRPEAEADGEEGDAIEGAMEVDGDMDGDVNRERSMQSE